jgi:hypothetical protein
MLNVQTQTSVVTKATTVYTENSMIGLGGAWAGLETAGQSHGRCAQACRSAGRAAHLPSDFGPGQPLAEMHKGCELDGDVTTGETGLEVS